MSQTTLRQQTDAYETWMTDDGHWTVEKYGQQWLVHEWGDCVPVFTSTRKADAFRWVADHGRQ